MLPTPQRLLSDLAFPLRRYGFRHELDPRMIAAMLDEAASLAAGDDRAEPATLFHACALRSRMFGRASIFILPLLTRAHAHAVGLVLHAEDVELAILHTRVLRREIAFDELRAWFDPRLRFSSGEP